MLRKIQNRVQHVGNKRYRIDFTAFKNTMGDKYFVMYLIKCLIGASVCYWLYVHYPGRQFIWSLVSVLLVIAPEDRDSIDISISRIEANIIGATIGMLCYLTVGINIVTLLIAILITISLCVFISRSSAIRTSLAALIIVAVLEQEKHNWHIALDRMFSVFIGCMVAVVLTFISYSINNQGKKADLGDGAE